MCQDTTKPIIAVCNCGAYFRNCDYLTAMLHVRASSALAHKWVYLMGNSFVAGRDGKTFNGHILLYGRKSREGE